MPQQQQDVFDQALAEMQTAPAANAPTPAPSWQQTFEKTFPAAAQASHQIGQVGQGLMQMAGSVSPLRFREGWDSPTLGMPEAVNAFVHPLNTLAGIIGSVKNTIGTTAREAGALVAPNSIQAPSQQEMDQATQGATQILASLIGPKIFKEGAPVAGKAIQTAATKAGVPQLMSEVAETPLAKVAGGRPIIRAAARRLYDPPEPPPTPTIDAQFVNSPEAPSPQGEYQDVPSRNIQRTGIAAGSQKALPPAPPPGQIAAAPTAPPISGTAPAQQALPPGVAVTEPHPIPGGRGQSTGSGVMTSGRGQVLGEPGGIGPQPHADIVAQRPMIVRTVAGDGSGKTPGQMRMETPNEMKARLANFGRGVTKQPTAEAEPLKLPKPTPPTRSK